MTRTAKSFNAILSPTRMPSSNRKLKAVREITLPQLTGCDVLTRPYVIIPPTEQSYVERNTFLVPRCSANKALNGVELKSFLLYRLFLIIGKAARSLRCM